MTPTVFPLQSRLLASVPGVVHGITRRVVGMGKADGNVGYSAPRDRDDAWEMRSAWCAQLGLDPERLVTLGQVHGASVMHAQRVDAGRGARPGSSQLGLGDGLITDERGPALMTLHADCLPIFFVDPERRAVAVAHAGWRGTVADVAGATVKAVSSAYGSRPDRLLAYLGPSIGPCCYEVGSDVLTAWRDQAGDSAALAIRRQGDRVTFDLRQANYQLLRHAGLSHDTIDVCETCTRCSGDEWFSHRGQGPLTGRFGAVISIVDES